MALRNHFIEMARNSAWSNLRLYRACEPLSQAELEAPGTSFFPSIWLTLVHLWIVDEFYVDGLEDGGRGARIWDDEFMHQNLASLRHAQASLDQRLIAVCERTESRTP